MALDKTDKLNIKSIPFDQLVIPDDAEVLLMPSKFIEIFRSIAHGNFLPFDIHLAIVCREDVPESEIWAAKAETVNITGGGEISRWKIVKVYTLKGGRYIPVLESILPFDAKVVVTGSTIDMPAVMSKDIIKKEDKIEVKQIETSNNISND